MEVYDRIQAVFLCAIIVFKTGTQARTIFSSQAGYGRRLTNIYGVSFEQCIDECDSRKACTSAIYVRRKLLCELNTGLGDSVTLRDLIPGYVHFQKVDTHQKYNQCTCSNVEKCVLSASGMTSCTVIECAMPDYPVTMKASDRNMNSIGAVATVSCKSKWRASMDLAIKQFTIECGLTGIWEGLDERKCGKVVFLQKQGIPGSYLAWSGTDEQTFTDDTRCNGMADGNVECHLSFRDNDIDQWEALNISRVLLSVYKNEAEVQYILFDGSESSSLSWFSQNKIVTSSWVDIKTEESNFFSIYGHLRFSNNCSLKRRFYISRRWHGCVGDAGWFVMTMPLTSPACCAWDNPENVVDILYSTAPTFCVFGNDTNVGHADYFTVVIFK